MRIAHRLLAGLGHPVSGTLWEGDQLAGFEVLETPGHSPGHLAFWRESDRVLVLGDVLFNISPVTGRPGLRLPPTMLTPDPALNLASVKAAGDTAPQRRVLWPRASPS